MITFTRIHTADQSLYQFMEDLMVASFPKEEYRELPILQKYTDTKEYFYNLIILDDDTPVGFITYWDLNEFFYVEHFAIDSSRRNGGYGKQVLEWLQTQLNKPIVLEVELPTEEMAQRRISFYERHGFVLWKEKYAQPPYRPGEAYLPMSLMVYGDISPEKFSPIRSAIYREVYGVKE